MRPLVWLGFLLSGSAGASELVDRVAAVVDDEVIALSEVYDIGRDFIVGECRDDEQCMVDKELEVLDALVRRALIRQELARLDLRVGASDIDQAIDQTVREYNMADRQALREEVERTGKTWAEYREEIAEFLRTQRFQVRVLAPRVTVNDDEVRDLYARSERAVKKPVVKISALGILFPPDADDTLRAEMVVQASELVGALNVEEVTYPEAVELYDGGGLSTVFADKEFKQGTLLAPVDAVVFDAPVGEFLPPIRVGDVLFILRVDERVDKVTDDVRSFEDSEEDLRNQVFQGKLKDAEEEWYQRARREAVVDLKISHPS